MKLNIGKFKIVSISLLLGILQIIFAQNYQTFNHQINERVDFSSNKNDSIKFSVVKNDFMVNEIAGEYGDNQSYISATADGFNNTLYAWIDSRNGRDEIMAQFFDNAGRRIGNNIIVSDQLLRWNNQPYVSSNIKGDFVVAWCQSSSEIMVQRFSKGGQKYGKIVKIIPSYTFNTNILGIETASDGTLLIAWTTDLSNGTDLIVVRSINKSNEYLSDEVTVNFQARNITSHIRGKQIEVDENDNFCISWSSSWNSNKSNIYAQVLDKNANLIGENELINDNSKDKNNYNRLISSASENKFLFLWENEDIVEARFFNFRTKEKSDIIPFYNSNSPISVSTDNDSLHYILFNGYQNSFIQSIHDSSYEIANVKMLNTYDEDFRSIFFGGVTDIVDNNISIAINAYLKGDQNVYKAQISLDKLSFPLTFNKINDDTFSSPQIEPYIQFNNLGESLIIWNDKRNGTNELFGQLFNKNFDGIKTNFKINKPNNSEISGNKKSKSISNGNFLVAFSDSEFNSKSDIWLQLINPNGDLIGENVFVASKYGSQNFNIELQTNNSDEILVCWFDRYGGKYKIFNKDLVTIRKESTFLSGSEYFYYNPISVSIDSNFNIFTGFVENNKYDYSSTKKIVGSFYSTKTLENSDTFLIDSTYNYIYEICVKNEGKDYIVISNIGQTSKIKRFYFDEASMFSDEIISCNNRPNFNILMFSNKKILISHSSCSGLYCYYLNDNRQYSETIMLEGSDFLNYSYTSDTKFLNSALHNSYIISAYESNKNKGTSSDIWASVKKLNNLNFYREVFFKKTNSDFLYANYPNPFNNQTKITYQIVAFTKVKLTVFDLLGREIAVLVDQKKEKGVHQVEFNSNGLASGVYFYKLDAFDTIIKKMIILK